MRARVRLWRWAAVALLAAAGPAAAQDIDLNPRPTGRCVFAADSAHGDTTPHLVYPSGGLEQAGYSLFLAPAAIMTIQGVGCEDRGDVVFWRDHVTAYVDGGGALAGWHGAFVRSAEVEAIVRGVYLDVRGEEYRYADRVRMWEARVGYFLHPVPPLAGGITIGWRGADDQPDGWATRGLEVGFPLVIKGCGTRRPCTIHLDQTYVTDGRHFRMSPRYRFEMHLAPTPFIARFDMDFKGVRNRSPLVGTLGLGFSP